MKNVQLIDDIRVNVSVPNIISLPLGGGTVIHVNDNDGSVRVGPDSVGYRLDQEALAFGGQTITATDVALAAGLASGVSFNILKILYQLSM
jgi:N-methylhydantoinase A/oxoprolinase/acetone carboxylase beta subunit